MIINSVYIFKCEQSKHKTSVYLFYLFTTGNLGYQTKSSRFYNEKIIK